MIVQKMSVEERIIKAKIKLQEGNPFWARMILELDIKEDINKVLPKGAGAGINMQGELFYNKEWMGKLTDQQIMFVLAHEVMHPALGHLNRVGSRDKHGWNVACDIIINNLLILNGFQPPKDVIIPEHNEIEIGKKVIDMLDQRTADYVYDQLPEEKSKVNGFDHHIFSEGKTEDKVKEENQKWNDAMVSASTLAKTKGDLPKGVSQYINNLMHPKLPWREILKRFILSTIVSDYSFARPNKKFKHVILPGPVKSNIDIVSSFDCSGSVSDDELRKYLSELVAIVQSYTNVNITLLNHDTDIHEVYELNTRNHDISKFKVTGRGGTSHMKVIEWIKKNKPMTNLYIAFTDGYSDIEQCFGKLNCHKIIALSGDKKELSKYGTIVNIER